MFFLCNDDALYTRLSNLNGKMIAIAVYYVNYIRRFTAQNKALRHKIK